MDLNRYSIINNKNKREMVLLKGNGCKWRKCRFCNYHFDYSFNEEENYSLNKTVLKNVTGIYKTLEVINSGSFTDLDKNTVSLIKDICIKKDIRTLHFECHWIHREAIKNLKKYFNEYDITVKIKSGIETFDYNFREKYLIKGIPDISLPEIAKYFDEVCLLFGIKGQTIESMENDIQIGLRYFERVCINIMTENGMPVKPDSAVIKTFKENLYEKYKKYENIDILIKNTDFGVGQNSFKLNEISTITKQ